MCFCISSGVSVNFNKCFVFAAQNSLKGFYASSINGFNLQVMVVNWFLNACEMKSSINIMKV